MFGFHRRRNNHRNRYRSARSVSPATTSNTNHNNGSNSMVYLLPPRSGNSNGGNSSSSAMSSHNMARRKLMYFVLAISILSSLLVTPIVMLENHMYKEQQQQQGQQQQQQGQQQQQQGNGAGGVVSLHSVMKISKDIQRSWHYWTSNNNDNNNANNNNANNNANNNNNNNNNHDSSSSSSSSNSSPLARGVSGLPMSLTPALIGASRGHIQQCDVPVNDEQMVYWNDPQGQFDQQFVSPFRSLSSQQEQFFTFEPDPGGWNNIRMSLEVMIVFAAVTGRTFVLPPKAPFYLLGRGESNSRSFGDFFTMEGPHSSIAKQINIITMKQFIQRHGTTFIHQLKHPSSSNMTQTNLLHQTLLKVADLCIYQDESDISCEILYQILRQNGYQPQIDTSKQCFVFDQTIYQNYPNLTDHFQQQQQSSFHIPDDVHFSIDRFCGAHRKPFFYTQQLANQPWIHWDASHEPSHKRRRGHAIQDDNHHQDDKNHRLLIHFYTFLYFTDPIIDNHYKRFVRDFVHYNDQIFCAAWKIIHALNQEVQTMSAEEDSPNSWSSLHVRRGDLQYKAVKFSAEQWYQNTKEIWLPHELLYIATDEQNRTFFDAFPNKYRHRIKFLNDYWDLAGLQTLDSAYLGMVDTIVASHGRVFAGTWFSTFTGYINRLRGYNGKSMKTSWYSFLDRKDVMQQYKYPEGNYYAREWPLAWLGIDGNQIIEHEYDHNENNSNNQQSQQQSLQIHVLPISSPLDPSTITLEDLIKNQDPISFQHKPVSRGPITGRLMEETPALIDAKRAHIECTINVDSLAYWNDPQGSRDRQFVSPFHSNPEDGIKYVSFSSDRGGWNNVRMSMEIIFVIAAATGRTIVLPPKEVFYLLHKGEQRQRHRGFADFFPLYATEFQKRVSVISFEEFVQREGISSKGRLPIPEHIRTNVTNAAKQCDRRRKSKSFCDPVFDYLQEVGHVPSARAQDHCVIFDEDVYNGRTMTPENQLYIDTLCGTRNKTYWNSELESPVLLHFRAAERDYRLLAHFYGFIHFTNPQISNYYKRFVRDFLHYHDEIYCAAGKIVKAIQHEAKQLGFASAIQQDGSGGFSAMHIRRGDFQYKKVKISAEAWYENTKEIWLPNEILYIATDEKNKSSLYPIAQGGNVLRFLDDYWDLAGLSDLDPNYMGMIDTIVASRARAFAGTWFSTFTGYINRMRGYHGLTMKDSWYSYLDRKTALHTWETPLSVVYAYEWPDGWIGIDSDVWPSKDKF